MVSLVWVLRQDQQSVTTASDVIIWELDPYELVCVYIIHTGIDIYMNINI